MEDFSFVAVEDIDIERGLDRSHQVVVINNGLPKVVTVGEIADLVKIIEVVKDSVTTALPADKEEGDRYFIEGGDFALQYAEWNGSNWVLSPSKPDSLIFCNDTGIIIIRKADGFYEFTGGGGGSVTLESMASLINSAEEKETLAGGDLLSIRDIVSGLLRKISITKFLLNLKAEFDTVYAALNHNHTGTYQAAGSYLVASDITTKADLVGGKVPASQLPAYVDEIIDLIAVTDTAPLTANTGEFYFNSVSKRIYEWSSGSWGNPFDPQSSVVYVAINTNKTYRWSGSVMAALDEGVVLGETASTAGRGDHVKAAYDYSQEVHAPADAQKNSNITKAEIEAKLTGELTSHSHDMSGKLSIIAASCTGIHVLTQVEYDALTPKISTVLYFIK